MAKKAAAKEASLARIENEQDCQKNWKSLFEILMLTENTEMLTFLRKTWEENNNAMKTNNLVNHAGIILSVAKFCTDLDTLLEDTSFNCSNREKFHLLGLVKVKGIPTDFMIDHVFYNHGLTWKQWKQKLQYTRREKK